VKAPHVLVSGVVLGQPAGGVRRHNAELLPRVARLLADRGGGLAVLEGRDPIAFELPEPIERIHSSVPASPPIARAAAEGHALRAAITDAARRGQPFDLLHTAHFPVPRGIPIPFTLTIHDLRSLSLRGAPLPRRIVAGPVIGGAARRAARVFTVSQATARVIAVRLRVPDACVIGNGGDHFQPLARSATFGAPLVHVGHLEPRKNVDLLLHALARDAQLPRLDLWGSAKGDEAARLAALARELGVADRVRLRGAYDDADLPAILSGCAAVVLPSRLEGFGIAVLEAQRALAPLAIADAGALPEVAGPDVPRFDPDDAVACATAIRAAIARSATDLQRDAERASAHTWDRAAWSWFEGWLAIGYDVPR